MKINRVIICRDERKREETGSMKGITGLLPVIQVEIFFFFQKKWGDGNGNKQWTGETLRRRSKQDLSPQE